MILGPHPSLLIVFVRYHYLVHGMIVRPILHAFAIYALTFLALSSLIVVLARDPGPVNDKSQEEAADEGEEDFMQALLTPPEGEEAHGPGKWCKRCNAPKPDRAHHCGTCGRCVLKMGTCLACLPGRFTGLMRIWTRLRQIIIACGWATSVLYVYRPRLEEGLWTFEH